MNAPLAALVPCPNHPLVTTGLGACGQCGKNFCGDCLVALGGVPTCAGCKQGRLSDLRSGVPELDLAGPWTRFAAQFLDGLVFLVPGAVLFFAGFFLMVGSAGGTPNPALPVAGAAFFLGFTFLAVVGVVVYEALMVSAYGQTLGKMALGIKVVTPQGGDVRAGQAWARAGSRAAMNTFYVGIIDILFIFSLRRQTLHDRIAQTVVVNWRR
jgi:uncharacterized RDD family membrane protein YckC